MADGAEAVDLGADTENENEAVDAGDKSSSDFNSSEFETDTEAAKTTEQTASAEGNEKGVEDSRQSAQKATIQSVTDAVGEQYDLTTDNFNDVDVSYSEEFLEPLNAKGGADGMNDAIEAIKDKPGFFKRVANACRDAIASLRSKFKGRGEDAGVILDGEFDKVDQAYKDFNERFQQDKKVTQDSLDKLKADIDKASADVDAKLEELASKDPKVKEDQGDESKWNSIKKILMFVGLAASILALFIMLAVLGASDDGCYLWTSKAIGSASKTGPIPGSSQPKIWGFGGGNLGGCLTPYSSDSITSHSCMCGGTGISAETPDKAKDTSNTTKVCQDSKGGPESAANSDAYPFCCQINSSQYINCTQTYGSAGTVTYTWQQTNPSDLLGNALNGAGKAAKDAGKGIGDLFKGFLDGLGWLKWVLLAIIGLMILLFVSKLISKFFGGKKEEKSEGGEGGGGGGGSTININLSHDSEPRSQPVSHSYDYGPATERAPRASNSRRSSRRHSGSYDSRLIAR